MALILFPVIDPRCCLSCRGCSLDGREIDKSTGGSLCVTGMCDNPPKLTHFSTSFVNSILDVWLSPHPVNESPSVQLLASTSDMSDQASSNLPLPTEVSHITSQVAQHRTILTEPAPQILEPHLCDRPACAASRVWETAELLEHILTFLPTNHVLPLRSVKKSWNILIQESPSLRLHLFVYPNWQHLATKFRLLPLSLPGLEIRRGNPVQLGHWIEVHMDSQAANTIMKDSRDDIRSVRSPMFFNDFEPAGPQIPTPQPFPPYADLLITQPPVVGMQAFIVDANATVPSKAHPVTVNDQKLAPEVPAAHSKLSCDAGLTMGFLAEIANKMLTKRTRGMYDVHYENEKVVFKAIVSFGQCDTAPRKRSGTRTITQIEQDSLQCANTNDNV